MACNHTLSPNKRLCAPQPPPLYRFTCLPFTPAALDATIQGIEAMTSHQVSWVSAIGVDVAAQQPDACMILT